MFFWVNIYQENVEGDSSSFRRNRKKMEQEAIEQFKYFIFYRKINYLSML